MSEKTPATLPGDKLRKAVQEYSDLTDSRPDSSHNEKIDLISKKFDLSPIESDFLSRQLKTNPDSSTT